METQLSLFDEVDEVATLKLELAQLKASSDAVRKGLFARHNELAKMYLELKKQVDEQDPHHLIASGH